MAVTTSSSGFEANNISDEPKQQQQQQEQEIEGSGSRRSGKACHQCRHGKYPAAACKNVKENHKPCRLTYCEPCLLNRYQMKLEIVEAQEDWKCPKCRLKCNCSVCLRKNGKEPTGRLAGKVNASGCASVSEFLRLNDGNFEDAKDTQKNDQGADREDGVTFLNEPSPRGNKKGKMKRGDKKGKGKLEGAELGKITEVYIGNSSESNNEEVKINKKVDRDLGVGKSGKNKRQTADVGIHLTDGSSELRNVAGVEMPIQDVGNALQFLEFCAAFGEILNLDMGQSYAILEEVINGRNRQEQYCVVAQFHTLLLSVILKDSGSGHQQLSPTGGKDSWFRAIKAYLSESWQSVKFLPSICLDEEDGEYDLLPSSAKLSLLNYLCDEALQTPKLRDWIAKEILKSAEESKEAGKQVQAAKDTLRQQTEDAKTGDPALSNSEHSEIKSEADQARDLLAKSKGKLKKQRPDALRTAPIHLDTDGRGYWRLNCYSNKSNILIQDIGTGDNALAMGEKWFVVDAGSEKDTQKRIKLRKIEKKAREESSKRY